MTEVELYAELRELLGNPDPNEVSNRQLASYMVPALEWLASELKYTVRTDDFSALLQSGAQEYPLPSDFQQMVWLEWNTVKLEPGSTFGWERDGIDWRHATAANPREYAIQGRKLILWPPPSASAIATDSTLSYRYIASTPGIGPGGTIGLADIDQQIALYRAAIRYCRSHPTQENALRAEGYIAEQQDLLPTAKRRALNPILDYSPHFRLHSGRRGAAR